MKRFLRFALVAPFFMAALHAQKPKITSQDQLPRYNYPLTGKVADVLTNDAAYAKLAAAVRADLEKLLADYDIADRATMQDVLGTLLALDVHDGRYDSALAHIATIRGLDEKPASQSPTPFFRRICGLQVANVQYPSNGFGANPESWVIL